TISSLHGMLHVFIVYLFITGIAVTGGRLGLTLPTISRYTTPVLMGWLALLILLMKNIGDAGQRRIKLIIALALFFLFPWQLRGLILKTNQVFERELAALAIKMQIHDLEQISLIHQSIHPKFLNIAKEAIERELSIFGTARFKGFKTAIGQTMSDH